ncbi:hypothetical protein, partial [Sulfitobacter geojensis]|uniref:hypothetical protein n=1 Tax=Sulfitobacter geojensis TaxID=1342299 RepID=UPI001EEE7AAB
SMGHLSFSLLSSKIGEISQPSLECALSQSHYGIIGFMLNFSRAAQACSVLGWSQICHYFQTNSHMPDNARLMPSIRMVADARRMRLLARQNPAGGLFGDHNRW